MKLIIDIQDFVYNHIKEFNSTQLYELNVISAIKNGTPLEEELVTELLDLWAEIDIYEAPIYDQPYCRGLKKAMEFIDKRISELKGEQK